MNNPTVVELGHILSALLSAESFLTEDARKRMRNDIYEHGLSTIVRALPKKHTDYSYYLFNRYENTHRTA